MMIGQVSAALETVELRRIRDDRLFEQWKFDSFKAFCNEMLPLNYRTYEERIQNLEKFGPSFIQWADRTGLSRRVVRTLRTLPPGEIKAFIARVEAGNVDDSELKMMAFDYAQALDDKKEAEAKTAELRKRADYLEDKARLSGQNLAKRDEDIKKLKAELHLAQNPKNLTQDDKKQCIATAKDLGTRFLCAVAAPKFDPENEEDIVLRAKLVGVLNEINLAAEQHIMLHLREAHGDE